MKLHLFIITKFVLVFENKISDRYPSEKLLIPVLQYYIYIYYGHKM